MMPFLQCSMLGFARLERDLQCVPPLQFDNASSQKQSALCQLPLEIFDMIIDYLSTPYRIVLALTCKGFWISLGVSALPSGKMIDCWTTISRSFWVRRKLLELLELDCPQYSFCFKCRALHSNRSIPMQEFFPEITNHEGQPNLHMWEWKPRKRRIMLPSAGSIPSRWKFISEKLKDAQLIRFPENRYATLTRMMIPAHHPNHTAGAIKVDVVGEWRCALTSKQYFVLPFEWLHMVAKYHQNSPVHGVSSEHLKLSWSGPPLPYLAPAENHVDCEMKCIEDHLFFRTRFSSVVERSNIFLPSRPQQFFNVVLCGHQSLGKEYWQFVKDHVEVATSLGSHRARTSGKVFCGEKPMRCSRCNSEVVFSAEKSRCRQGNFFKVTVTVWKHLGTMKTPDEITWQAHTSASSPMRPKERRLLIWDSDDKRPDSGSTGQSIGDIFETEAADVPYRPLADFVFDDM